MYVFLHICMKVCTTLCGADKPHIFLIKREYFKWTQQELAGAHIRSSIGMLIIPCVCVVSARLVPSFVPFWMCTPGHAFIMRIISPDGKIYGVRMRNALCVTNDRIKSEHIRHHNPFARAATHSLNVLFEYMSTMSMFHARIYAKSFVKNFVVTHIYLAMRGEYMRVCFKFRIRDVLHAFQCLPFICENKIFPWPNWCINDVCKRWIKTVDFKYAQKNLKQTRRLITDFDLLF